MQRERRPILLQKAQERSAERACVAVVIPCYRVVSTILEVIAGIGPEVSWIICIDDACPDGSGAHIEANSNDERVQVIHHEVNKGIGGAVLTGYAAAIEIGAAVVVKIDGDGQMDPAIIPRIIRPIIEKRADYVKGNRFYNVRGLHKMPLVRLMGNSLLSFATKLSSGYWHIFDPTNGYTAIHRVVIQRLDATKIAQRYFFESDMLYHLFLRQAVVIDVPLEARYGNENSNLVVRKIIIPFVYGHARNFLKRIVYTYFLRDFNIASVEIVLGIILFSFGVIYGIANWLSSITVGEEASAGTVMVAALPIILGFQLILSFLSFDIQAVPQNTLQGSVGDVTDSSDAPERDGL